MAKVERITSTADCVTFHWDEEPTLHERRCAVYRHRRATAPERTLNLGDGLRIAPPEHPTTKHLVPDG